VKLTFIKQLLAYQAGSSLDSCIQELRSHKKEFEAKLQILLQKEGVYVSPKALVAYLPPVAIMNQLFFEATNKLSRIKERDFTEEEIIREVSSPPIVNPLTLLSERRKHLRAKAQCDSTKKFQRMIGFIQWLRSQAFKPDSDLSRLFAKQQDALPSYARERVS
jgi:hypothetical protein